MLQLIHEMQALEVGENNGSAYADFILEDGDYMRIAVDLRSYSGPLAEWAKKWEVVMVYPEDLKEVFREDSKDLKYYVPYVFRWVDYCQYVNNNTLFS